MELAVNDLLILYESDEVDNSSFGHTRAICSDIVMFSSSITLSHEQQSQEW